MRHDAVRPSAPVASEDDPLAAASTPSCIRLTALPLRRTLRCPAIDRYVPYSELMREEERRSEHAKRTKRRQLRRLRDRDAKSGRDHTWYRQDGDEPNAPIMVDRERLEFIHPQAVPHSLVPWTEHERLLSMVLPLIKTVRAIRAELRELRGLLKK